MAPTYFVPRPELSKTIIKSFSSRKRLLVRAPFGAGRATLVTHALKSEGVEVHVVDLRHIFQPRDLSAAFAATGLGVGVNSVLAAIDARALTKPVALVLRDIDGCVGAKDESTIVGSLRSDMQAVHNAGIFYTASDEGFLTRNFSHPMGSFFKQAVFFDLPLFSPTDIDTWAYHLTGQFLAGNVRTFTISCCGLLPANLEVLLNRLLAARKTQPETASSSGPFTLDEVLASMQSIQHERSHLYENFLRCFLTPPQRAVLSAIARGFPIKATREIQAASGVSVASMSKIIERLTDIKVLDRAGGLNVFVDPFLRFHLANPGSK